MPETKEWTLMFYFASDNPLGPTIVSQLKALKQAGFHPEANVIAYYDPPVPGTPTHIFDVNITEKIKAHGGSKIGFGARDSFVRNLVEDKLWGDQESIDGKKIRDLIAESLHSDQAAYDPPDPLARDRKKLKRGATLASSGDNHKEDGESPETSLGGFLEFCSKHYPARHYILFILGHGLVVGNDVFLYDEDAPVHSLSLKTLGVILNEFKDGLKQRVENAQFELVSFHSCSMSSLEVAYELQDTANYMLAAQCPTSVGAFPYRQIVMRVLNDLNRGRKDIETTLSRIFDYCMYNSFDFQLAGYSFDLSLCDLRKTGGIKRALSKLSKALIGGLKTSAAATDAILLAHWDAQSYWAEMYTDLYDFCDCLKRRCGRAVNQYESGSKDRTALEGIQAACQEMTTVLERKAKSASDQLIVRSDFVGPAFQYAHGLSVYFPWSQPFRSQFWTEQYGEYKLMADGDAPKDETKEQTRQRLRENPSWRDFLKVYFHKTMRKTRHQEQEPDTPIVVTSLSGKRVPASRKRVTTQAMEAMTLFSVMGGELGNRSAGEFLGDGKVGGADGTGDPGKVGGADGTGGDFFFSTVKNYPPFTRDRERNKSRSSKNGGPTKAK